MQAHCAPLTQVTIKTIRVKAIFNDRSKLLQLSFYCLLSKQLSINNNRVNQLLEAHFGGGECSTLVSIFRQKHNKLQITFQSIKDFTFIAENRNRANFTCKGPPVAMWIFFTEKSGNQIDQNQMFPATSYKYEIEIFTQPLQRKSKITHASKNIRTHTIRFVNLRYFDKLVFLSSSIQIF